MKTHAALLVLMDVFGLALGCAVSVIWRLPEGERLIYFQYHTTSWVVMFGSIIIANVIAGSYRLQGTYSRFNLVVTWLFSLAFAVVFMTMASYLRMISPLGRGVLWRMVLVCSVFVLALKLLFYRRIFRSPFFLCRTLILGVGERAWALRDVLDNEYVLPHHRVVAYLDIKGSDKKDDERTHDGIAIIASEADSIEDVVKSLGADLIVVALGDGDEVCSYYPRLRKLRFDGIEVLMDWGAMEVYSGRTPLEHLSEEFMMDVSMQSGLPTVRQMKRMMDIAMSLAGMVLLSPIIAFVALLVKLSDVRSPVFYTQVRVGQFGHPFSIYKFRTMREGAEDDTGAIWSGKDDPRVTRIGRVLRRFRMDEIPQFFNILKGEMSLVGPRPERPAISAGMGEKIPFYHERENVPPGLTGWAQVRYPYGDTIEDTKTKLEFDLFYIKNMSLSLDLQIILSTFRIVMLGMERSH